MTKVVKNWTACQYEFMHWLITLEYERLQPHQAALAAHLGKAEETLSHWKRLPGFAEEVNRLVKANLGNAYAEVMAALVREAKKGSITAHPDVPGNDRRVRA